MGDMTSARVNRAIRDVEDIIAERQRNSSFLVKFKKRLDIRDALRYYRIIAKIKQKGRKQAMSDTTTKTTKKTKQRDLQTTTAAIIGAPFIINGVASLVQSDVPYFEYLIGALVAGLVVNLLFVNK